MRRALLAVVAAAMAAGCAPRVDPADLAELESVKKQNAALNAQLEETGVRMLEAQHLVSTDAELRDRHQHVSQVACANMSDNWAGINRFLDNQREKETKKRRARVASAEVHDD